MSGRDLRKFVNFHRNAIGASDSSLVSRAIEGHSNNRYRPADYDKLKAITQLKEATSKHTQDKIDKITQASKNKKEHNLLQQHRACWLKENIRLKSQQRRLESEIDAIRPGSPFDYCTIKEFFKELEVLESILNDDMKDFKKNTVEPLWDLREDVQFWLSENRERLIFGEVDKEHADVLNVIDSVKAQQKSVQEKLLCEKEQLEAELEVLSVHQILAESSGAEIKIKKGIPEEALQLDCPDEHLKESVLNEFHLLDKKYEAHLEFLDLKYKNVLFSSTGGWSREDHFHFVHLLDQYATDLPNRRTLYMDRMMREIPHATRSQLVEHEEWLLGYRFYQNQHSSTLRAWASDKEDLLMKVKATFADAWVAHEEALEKAHARKKQEQICKHLYEKVLAYREQKLEVLRLKAAIAAKRQEEQELILQREEEKEMKRREKTYKQIEEYHLKQQREREAAALAEKKRLEEIQIKLAEQAKLDRERVQFREEKLQEQRQARQIAEEQAREAEKEKERRLEKLRELVQPHVESNPERLLKPTEASQAKAGSIYDEELELQQPLFNMYGFSETQVRSDARLKVELALRDAGLHNTDYARQVMAKVKPPTQPRKDQQSTIFKYD